MRYAAGVDVSGGSGTDEFAWCVAHIESELIVVDLVKGRGRRGRVSLDLDGTVAECAEDLRTYGLTTILGDRYGGDWPPRNFQRHGIMYQQSPRAKPEVYAALVPLITARRVQLPPDPETLRQVKLLKRRAGTGGRDVIDHPNGAHDDRANALALAVTQLAPQFLEVDLRTQTIMGPPRAWVRSHEPTAPWFRDDSRFFD